MPVTEDAELRASRYPDGGDRENILVEEVVLGDAELPGTILRYPMVYGPNDGGRIASDLKRMVDGRPAILLDERLAAWCWTRGYAENCAHAAVLAVTMDRAAGRVYNVGEIDALPMSSWIALVGEAAGWSGDVLPLPAEQLPPHFVTRHNFVQDWVADTDRIRAELGYEKIVDRQEAIKRTVRWWEEELRSGRPHPMDTLPRADDYQAEDVALHRRLL